MRINHVWAVAPSIRPNGGTLPKWRESGYKVAVLRQGELFSEATVTLQTDHYLGWAKSINALVKLVMRFDKEAEWFVNSNDDTLPDPNHTPEEIAGQCSSHFHELNAPHPELAGLSHEQLASFGVMQPTGDYVLWPGSNIKGFAGSPWMGRSWCERAYSGTGPLFEGYRHNFADQELQEVATKLGVFWQRNDLIHQHNHVGRSGNKWAWEEFQKPLNTPQAWNESKALFESRRTAGFPGHEPLPIARTGGYWAPPYLVDEINEAIRSGLISSDEARSFHADT